MCEGKCGEDYIALEHGTWDKRQQLRARCEGKCGEDYIALEHGTWEKRQQLPGHPQKYSSTLKRHQLPGTTTYGQTERRQS